MAATKPCARFSQKNGSEQTKKNCYIILRRIHKRPHIALKDSGHCLFAYVRVFFLRLADRLRDLRGRGQDLWWIHRKIWAMCALAFLLGHFKMVRLESRKGFPRKVFGSCAVGFRRKVQTISFVRGRGSGWIAGNIITSASHQKAIFVRTLVFGEHLHNIFEACSMYSRLGVLVWGLKRGVFVFLMWLARAARENQSQSRHQRRRSRRRNCARTMQIDQANAI